MRFDLASEADDAGLRRLLRESPMSGRIRVALQREPSFFSAAAIEGDSHQIIVARDERTGRLLGMGGRCVFDAFVNGEPMRLGYLSQLRIDPRFRGHPRMLVGGYAKLRELHRDGEASFYVTTIIEDNQPARRIFEAGLARLPVYRPLGRLATLILPVRAGRRSRSSSVETARGEISQLGDIVDCLQRNARRYQFARCWTAERIVSDKRTRGLEVGDFYVAKQRDRIVGCLACWDQRAFKQTLVYGYDPWLGLVRPVLNLVRRPHLPRPGGVLHGAFVSHVAVDDDDREVMLDLLAALYDDAAGGPFDHLILGFSDRSPLLPAVKDAYPHREYPSVIYAVHWGDGLEAVRGLDSRPPHLEAACL